MSTNKNAQLRYRVLDKCFSNYQKQYEIDDLLEAVNDALYDMYGTHVSLRQIREDIKYMRDRITYDAPIKAYPFDGKKCYYRYEDSDFSIFKTELSEKDINSLQSTIAMLSKYRGLPANAWLEEVISSLEFRFGIKASSENVISFEQNEQYKGLEHLSFLIDATINHIPLNIKYKSFKGNSITTTIHPYLIKQYNNRWFLFGLETNKKFGNHIVNKALDRITGISNNTSVSFIPNTFMDTTSYFADIIGVTIPDNHPIPEKIVLKFDAERYPYIMSKPIHSSQRIIDKTDCIIELILRVNKEFESLIFSFGPQVEVIAPDWFRNQIITKTTKNLNNYLSVQKDCTITN